jgi:hypothetical protein
MQMTDSAAHGKVVVLNGFPGSGKLTILNQVKAVLLATNTPCTLMDNHLLIDPVASVIPDRNDEHYQLRRVVRAPVLHKLRQRVHRGYTVLMTACLAAGNQVDAAFLDVLLQIVRGTDSPIYWLNVHCDQATLEMRLTSSERNLGTKTKLTDVHILRQIIGEHSLIQPSNDPTVNLLVETLDVSGPVESSTSLLVNIIGVAEATDPAA